jgi:deazaflavin-dependent oxidoreductase (nitroreductase family)
MTTAPNTTTAPPPARIERQARMMRMANVPMRAMLRLPFPTPVSGALMLVTHTGRVTGRTYRQPVSYVRDGDVLLTPGGGRWTRNLRPGEPVTVRLRGRDVVARPDLVRDPGEVDGLLRRMLAVNPRLARFVPFVERDGTTDGEKLATALGHGFCVVRWHLAPGQPS